MLQKGGKVAPQKEAGGLMQQILVGTSLKSRVARLIGLIGFLSSLDAILGRFNINIIEQIGLNHWLFFSIVFNFFLVVEIVAFNEATPEPESNEYNSSEVRVFQFILPTDGIKPFYNLFIEATSQCLEAASDRAWLLCPRIPTTSFDKLDIWQSYEEATTIRKATGGLFLLADDPDENYAKIVSRSQESNIPIVMVDVYFDMPRYDSRRQSVMPHFVGGDEIAGGRLAAEILHRHYIGTKRKNTISEPKILIVKGGNTPWELQRIDSFRSSISTKIHAEITETDFLFYHREDAFDAVYHLFSTMNKDHAKTYIGIFSANDDMAMGARSALREINRLKGIPLNVPIVGYDGTPEVKRIIDRNDEFIIGTVDVRLEDQAKQSVYVMKNIIEGSPPKERIHLVLPRMYTRLV